MGRRYPEKKSFPWNKSGGRQLVEMHGIRSVKGKAEAAEQFRLECVYADASPSLSFCYPSAAPSALVQPQLLFFIGVGDCRYDGTDERGLAKGEKVAGKRETVAGKREEG